MEPVVENIIVIVIVIEFVRTIEKERKFETRLVHV